MKRMEWEWEREERKFITLLPRLFDRRVEEVRRG
jgi:hypothetical protein